MTVRNAPVLTAPRPSRGRLVPRAIGVAFAACAALAACTNSPPAPKTFVLASLGASRDASNNNLCNYNSMVTVLSIGTAAGTDPIRASDGDTQMGASVVHVTCSVGGSFDINVSASLGGVQGGSLTIVGHVDAASGGTGIHGSLTAQKADGTFTQDNCTIGFTYVGAPVPLTPPVAPGRVWAHLSCPTMLNMSGKFVMIMSGLVQETCDLEVDFLFENCAT